MKKRGIISALVLTLAIGMGTTAFAATTENANLETVTQRLGLGRITSMRGFDYITNILKDKLGMSEREITNGLNSGKTGYDLVVEKGMSEEEFKASLTEEKTKAIDAAVAEGTITKEEGENIKANLKTNMENCTGNYGENKRQGNGEGKRQGGGMRGKGQQKGCLAPAAN